MGITLDFTKLIPPPRPVDNCTVLDIGSGSFPREIEVRLPGADGSRLTVIWYGDIALAVNDVVRIWIDPAKEVAWIAGFGGATSDATVDKARVSKLVSPDLATDPVLSADNSGDVTAVGSILMSDGEEIDSDGALIIDAAGETVINAAGGFIVNNDGIDADTRIAGNGNANMVFVDAGNDRVGIGTNAPDRVLHVEQSWSSADGIKIENTRAVDDVAPASLLFDRTAIGGGTPAQTAEVGVDHTARDFFVAVNAEDRLNIYAGDEFVINEAGADRDFRVESDGNANIIFVDAGNDRVGFGGGSPAAAFHYFFSTAGVPDVIYEDTTASTGDAIVEFRADDARIFDARNLANTLQQRFQMTAGGDMAFQNRVSAGYIRFYTDGGAGTTERLRIEGGGDVGIGTANPGQILDVNQGSGNMIADDYDTHSLSEYKDEIGPPPRGLTEILKRVPLYQFRKTPFVSTAELINAAEKAFDVPFTQIGQKNEGRRDQREWLDWLENAGEETIVPETDLTAGKVLDWINRHRIQLREERRKLPRWQRRHLGLVADDEATLREIPDVIARNRRGEIVGISLGDYVGLLHGVIRELIERVEKMEAR